MSANFDQEIKDSEAVGLKLGRLVMFPVEQWVWEMAEMKEIDFYRNATCVFKSVLVPLGQIIEVKIKLLDSISP